MTAHFLSLIRRARCHCLLILSVIAGLAGITDRVQAAQSVELTWNDSPSPNVVSYKVYFGTQSRVYPNSITYGVVSDVTIPTLAAGVTYYFSVTATDANGSESPFSTETTYTVPGSGSISLQVEQSTQALEAVDLYWPASSDSDVFGYSVTYWIPGSGTTNSDTFYYTTNGLISGLAPDATYEFSVSPIDSYGIEAVASSPVAYTVPAAEDLGLQADVPANTSGVELTWNDIEDEGVVSYNVYYGTQSGNYTQSQNCGDVNDFIVYGVTPGQLYYFVIAPVDAYGNQGAYSSEVSSVAAGPVPIQILSAQGTTAAWEAVDVSWLASSDSDVYGYAVFYGSQPGVYTNSEQFYGVTDGIISDLAPGTKFYFAVAPIDSYGVEAVASSSVSYSVAAPPSLVLQAKASANPRGVELSWNSIANEGVASYTVYYGTQSGSYSYSQSYDSSVNDVVIQGLVGGQTNYFVVNASDAYGNQSPYSTEVSAVPPKPAPMKLDTTIYYDGNGQPYLMEINTPSTVSGNWEVDSSSDLQNWTPYQDGYGSGNGDGYDVDVYVSIDPTQPPVYFRAINY